MTADDYGVIVVEGTELVGKSTLIAQIVRGLFNRRCRFTYNHFGLLPEDWDYSHDYLQTLNVGTILDRFIDSELVYSPVLRNKPPKISARSEAMIRERMVSLKTLTIYCRCSEDVLAERKKTRGEALSLETISAVNRGFEELYGLVGVSPHDSHWGVRSVDRGERGIIKELLCLDTTRPISQGDVDQIADRFAVSWATKPTTVIRTSAG